MNHFVCAECRRRERLYRTVGLLAVVIKGEHPCAVCQKVGKVNLAEGPAPVSCNEKKEGEPVKHLDSPPVRVITRSEDGTAYEVVIEAGTIAVTRCEAKDEEGEWEGAYTRWDLDEKFHGQRTLAEANADLAKAEVEADLAKADADLAKTKGMN